MDSQGGARSEDGRLLAPYSADSEGKPLRKHSTGRRMLGKTGASQIVLLHVPNKSKRFAQDLFNTLVECRWRYTLLVFLLSHFFSWFVFAVVFYFMSVAHGDMDEAAAAAAAVAGEERATACLLNVRDFTGAFIFSMESQTTIGYGTAYPSSDCPQALVVLCFQSVCGMVIEAVSVGIVFAKLTRPIMRTQTLLFSRKAVVAMRDGFLTLMFRISDIRKSQLVNARLWVVVRGLHDPDDVENDQTELPVSFNGQNRNLSTIWPTTVMHRIDDRSPLYRVDPREFLGDTFELLVYLEGTIQATGQTTQARTSYSSSDIMWGHKLYPMLRYNKKHSRFEADYNRFHETIEVETPLCSAADLNRVRRLSELSALHPISERQEEISIVVNSA